MSLISLFMFLMIFALDRLTLYLVRTHEATLKEPLDDD